MIGQNPFSTAKVTLHDFDTVCDGRHGRSDGSFRISAAARSLQDWSPCSHFCSARSRCFTPLSARRAALHFLPCWRLPFSRPPNCVRQPSPSTSLSQRIRHGCSTAKGSWTGASSSPSYFHRCQPPLSADLSFWMSMSTRPRRVSCCFLLAPP